MNNNQTSMHPKYIDQPCPQNWNAMHAAEGGKYCSGCEKIVIDFTACTDEEIKATFQQLGAQTCGRFREDQLPNQVNIKKTASYFIKFQALVLLSLLGIGVKPLKAQESIPPSTIETVPDSIDEVACFVPKQKQGSTHSVTATDPTVKREKSPAIFRWFQRRKLKKKGTYLMGCPEF